MIKTEKECGFGTDYHDCDETSGIPDSLITLEFGQSREERRMKSGWKLGLQGLVMTLLTLLFTADVALAYPGLCESKKKIPRSAPDYVAVSIICGDSLDQLPQLDLTLNGYYRAAMERSKNREALRQEQLAWLKQRNACDTRHCIVKVYHRRILELALVPAKAAIHEFKSGGISSLGIYILTREMGLKHFDSGRSDYDMVTISRGDAYDLSRPCKDRFFLIGMGISVFTPCRGAAYGIFKPVMTFDGKKFQLPLSYELGFPVGVEDDPDSPNDPYTDTLPDGGRIVNEESLSRLWEKIAEGRYISEPFHRQLTRMNAAGQVLWQWHIVTRSPFPQTPGKAGLAKVQYSDSSGSDLTLLADGSILMFSELHYRLDPSAGTFYDTNNTRLFTLEQVRDWKESWARAYIALVPACGGNIRKCPDREAALGYLWQRFNEEMDRQFATPSSMDK